MKNHKTHCLEQCSFFIGERNSLVQYKYHASDLRVALQLLGDLHRGKDSQKEDIILDPEKGLSMGMLNKMLIRKLLCTQTLPDLIIVKEM